MPDEKKKAVFFGLGAVALVIVGLFCCCGGGGIFWLVMPRNETLYTSESPEDALRVEVIHHKPGWFRSAPHQYDITLIDRKSGKALDGDSGHLNLESAQLTGVSAVWASGSCILTEKTPGNIIMMGSYEKGKQNWLVVAMP